MDIILIVILSVFTKIFRFTPYAVPKMSARYNKRQLSKYSSCEQKQKTEIGNRTIEKETERDAREYYEIIKVEFPSKMYEVSEQNLPDFD